MTNEMYYIQRYKAGSYNKQAVNSDRYLSADYMGSAEFEWGSIPAAWKSLRMNNVRLFTHEVQSKGGKAALVRFFVVTTENGFERFKDQINIHLDGTYRGSKAKNSTGLWEKFNASGLAAERHAEFTPDAWLDVSPFVYRRESEDCAIFFSDNAMPARQVYIDVMRGYETIDYSDLRIGDMVLSPLSDELVKVCGLNADDTISVKTKYGKAHKFNKLDLIHERYLEGIAV